MIEKIEWQISSAQAYGGVLINERGEVLLREPTNHFDGYVWTFAKGKPDHKESPATTALREVFEETGYRAKIIGVLPGLFKSGNSSSAFFIMIPDDTQATEKFHWETQSIDWCSFSKARAKVALSTNKLGRQRDLHILNAAENWFLNCLPIALLEKIPVIKTDWKIIPLPEDRISIDLNMTFTRQQAACLMVGFLPKEMEDKWFSYFENNVLYQHRSWTGFGIDEIHFTELSDGCFKASHALVNRNVDQYGNTDENEDKERIQKMLKELSTLMNIAN